MNTTSRRGSALSKQEIRRSVNDLLGAVSSLVKSLDAAARALAKTSKGSGGLRGEFTPSRRAKLKKSIRAYWSSLTPAQHRERVRKMLAGRGLKPKGE
jgi:hypothetical protein